MIINAKSTNYSCYQHNACLSAVQVRGEHDDRVGKDIGSIGRGEHTVALVCFTISRCGKIGKQNGEEWSQSWGCAYTSHQNTLRDWWLQQDCISSIKIIPTRLYIIDKNHSNRWANFSMRRSIFCASPGRRNPDRNNLHTKKYKQKATGWAN